MLRGSANHCAVSQQMLRMQQHEHKIAIAVASKSAKPDSSQSHLMLRIGAAQKEVERVTAARAHDSPAAPATPSDCPS